MSRTSSKAAEKGEIRDTRLSSSHAKHQFEHAVHGDEYRRTSEIRTDLGFQRNRNVNLGQHAKALGG